MNKITVPVILLVVVALFAGGYLLFSGDKPESLDDTLKVVSNEGAYPGAKQIAKDFITQLEKIAQNNTVNYETVKNTADEVIYKNIVFDVVKSNAANKAMTTKKDITNIMIKKAKFTDDGAAEISNFLMGSQTESGDNVALGLKKASISNYKLQDGLLISIDQSFEGGIASGEGLTKLQDGINKIKQGLKEQSQELQDLPDAVINSLANISGVVNYRYNPKLENLATGFQMELPDMAALEFSMAVSGVNEKSARMMQQSVLFGGAGKDLSENLKDYDFKGILEKARIEIKNDGLIDKAFTLIASFQKPKGTTDIEPIKQNFRNMAIQFIEGYQSPKKNTEATNSVINDVKKNLVALLKGDQDSITLSIVPKENGIQQTVPQAVASSFDQYQIKVSD